MLATCAEPGCETFVLGGCCLEHEQPQTRVFVRGRPFVKPAVASVPRQELRRTLVRATGAMAVVRDARPARVPVLD